MRALSRLLIVLGPVVLLGAGPTESGWSAFRGGPAQTGVASDPIADELALRWRVETGGPIKSSPVVDAERIYIGSDDGNLWALTRGTGAVAWKADLGGPVSAPPRLHGGAVFVGSEGGRFAALDVKTGAVRWTHDGSAKITGGAAVLGDLVVVGDHAGTVHGLDAATGAPRWTYETGSYVYGAPAVAGTRLVLGGCDGYLHVLDATGKVERKIEVRDYVGASVALAGEQAYVGHFGNQLLAFEPATGETAWTFAKGAFPFLSSAAVTDDLVVLGSRDRNVYGVDRKTGAERWAYRALAKVDSSPVAVGDKLVVGSHDGRLYVLTIADGLLLWFHDLGAAISGSPAVTGGHVYVGAEDGALYAFGPAEARQ